ncbi:phage portal protein [Thermodesulfobacteriota bacterium]
MNAEQISIFEKAVSAFQALNKPLLYGPNGKPLKPSGDYALRRAAAKRKGSMKNWVPRMLSSRQQEALDREMMMTRSTELVNDDPNAAGVSEVFSHTVVGPGLKPQPLVDPDAFPDIEKEKARALQAQMRNNYREWFSTADAGGRLNDGQIQFLIMRNILQYGEYLVLLPMLDDPTRPFSLACQVLNPMRLKTPIDLEGKLPIRDGVELGSYGEPVAYWIKRSDAARPTRYSADIKKNFLRVPAKKAHRWNVLHGFMAKDAEEVRGVPFFAPAMQFFRNLNDLLDAELVSNVVTAALAVWIEQGLDGDPYQLANNMAGRTESGFNPDGEQTEERYEELIPGSIMYGLTGQKPHLLSANRPGTTFEPFVTTIKKAISMALGMPYPVLFRDVEGVNFAGFRSAMLDAWRVFMTYRSWLGHGYCQRVFTMLQEEAWLRGRLDIEDFYPSMHALTRADWHGAPKGDIEPIKAVKADLMAIDGKIKTRAEAIAERGSGEWRRTFDQLEEEKQELENRGLDTPKPSGPEGEEEETTEEEAQGQAMLHMLEDLTEAVEDLARENS